MEIPNGAVNMFPPATQQQQPPAQQANNFTTENKTPTKPRAVCRHWARGYCQLGEQCKFAHPAQQTTATEYSSQFGAYGAQPMEPQQQTGYGAAQPNAYPAYGEAPQGYPAQMQPTYDPYGQSHVQGYEAYNQPMRRAPYYAPAPAGLAGKRRLRKSRCRHWARGYCQLGQACNFAHTGAPGPANGGNQKPRGKVDCRHWIGKGYCSMGSACNFLHTAVPGSKSKSRAKRTTACRHFLRGKCDRGDSCMFAHVMASEEIILPPVEVEGTSVEAPIPVTGVVSVPVESVPDAIAGPTSGELDAPLEL